MSHASVPVSASAEQPDLEALLDWSWLGADDLPALNELREATDYLDDPVERVDLPHLRDLFEAPDADPGRNAVVGRNRNGSVLAYAWGHPRRGEGELRWWIDWAVHPAWRYRGIGDACLDWLYERGLQWRDEQRALGIDDPLWMGAYIDEKLGLRVTQMERHGYTAEKWFSDMKVLFSEVEPEQFSETLPEGVRLVAFTPALSEKVRRAHNEALSTVPGSQRVSRQVWEHTLRVTTMRPEWSVVAVVDSPTSDDVEVVGYALSSGYAAEWESQGYTEGWTEFLGTVPAWRGRGIARAVLARTLKTFKNAGLAGAGLGVDADRDEAAQRLFSDLGFRPYERLVLMGARPTG